MRSVLMKPLWWNFSSQRLRSWCKQRLQTNLHLMKYLMMKENSSICITSQTSLALGQREAEFQWMKVPKACSQVEGFIPQLSTHHQGKPKTIHIILKLSWSTTRAPLQIEEITINRAPDLWKEVNHRDPKSLALLTKIWTQGQSVYLIKICSKILSLRITYHNLAKVRIIVYPLP